MWNKVLNLFNKLYKKIKRFLTPEEIDALDHVLEKMKKPQKLKKKHFRPGTFIFYTYSAKYDKNPYDRTPIILVLRRGKKYTLGWNINWTPPKLRKKALAFIMKHSKLSYNRLGHGEYIVLNRKVVLTLFKYLKPAIRLYINDRISKQGVVMHEDTYKHLPHLRSETFMGISANKAWRIATKQMKI